MQKIVICLAFVVLAAAAVVTFGTRPAHVLAGCSYKGGDSALPKTATPYSIYGNGSAKPSGHIGFHNGSKSGYLQASGDSGGIQVEGSSETAGRSAYANTSGDVKTSC